MRTITHRNNRNGFSLVEMAVLLVIIGLTVATLYPRVISRDKQNALAEHKHAARQIRNEIIGYAKRHGALPDQAQFHTLTHSRDRMRLPLEYNSNSSGALTVTLANGNKETVAFWVASLGQNRVPDQGNSYNGTTQDIVLHALAPDTFDDVVDYATVASLTPDSNSSGNTTNPGEIPNTDNYYDGILLYLGNSSNIEQIIFLPFSNIKFTKPKTKIAGNLHIISAKAISFEENLDIQPNTELHIRVSQHVLFKKEIIFSTQGNKKPGIIEIQKNIFADYPIHIYMLKSVYNALSVTGDITEPLQEITNDGQTYVKIDLLSGTLTIQPQ